MQLISASGLPLADAWRLDFLWRTSGYSENEQSMPVGVRFGGPPVPKPSGVRAVEHRDGAAPVPSIPGRGPMAEDPRTEASVGNTGTELPWTWSNPAARVEYLLSQEGNSFMQLDPEAQAPAFDRMSSNVDPVQLGLSESFGGLFESTDPGQTASSPGLHWAPVAFEAADGQGKHQAVSDRPPLARRRHLFRPRSPESTVQE